jgi:hypothetical protein
MRVASVVVGPWEKKHGRGVAHKTLRVWRTFWKVMRGSRIRWFAGR